MSQVADGATTRGDVVEGAGTADAPAVGPGARWRRWWERLARTDRVLLGALVVGAAVRLWGLGAQSLWYDEWLTSEAASGTLGHLRRYVTDQAGIPPTYFAVMWVWARVVGDGDGALRFLSALVGVATVPVVYAAVRELAHRRAAQMAALLTAVNPMLVWYSQEARPYSLLAFVAALSLLALARFWARGRHLDLVLWALACACMIAIHYFAVFLVAAEALALLAVRRPGWRNLLVASSPAAVVLALLSPFAVRQFSRRSNHSWITDFPMADRLSDAGRGALVGPVPPEGWMWTIAAAVAALAVVLALARGDGRERRAAIVAGGIGVGSVLIALGATVVGVDVVIARYLIGSLVVLIAVVAIGLGAARAPRALGWSAAAVVCGLSLVVVAAGARDAQLQRADWRAVAEAHEAGGTDTGVRLLVLNIHGYLGQPLYRYLDGARRVDLDETVRVDQIDVLVAKPTDAPCNLFVGLECGMAWLGGPPPEPVAGQLRLDERIELDQFAIDRYRSDDPIAVTPTDLVRADTRRRSLVLVTEG